MNDYIELSIKIDDQLLCVREDLPALIRLSSGPMSMVGAMSGSIDRMTGRMAELLSLEKAKRESFVAWIQSA